jgi:hypothetical protein
MNANTNNPSRPSVQRLVVPQTEVEWCAYRCQLSCQIGRDVLEGKTKTPRGVSPLEYAVFNLLHAIEELSRQNKKGQP